MSRDEEGLLRAILREGLLTESQGRRVARAIQHGASLEEALGRTPLVDPLDYQKVLRGAEHPSVETLGASTGSGAPLLERVATFDLGDHEEIPLVMRLYELLGEVFYSGMKGLEIGRMEMEAGWVRLLDGQGRCMEERPMEPVQAEKMIARLRVMGRMAPSRREAQVVMIGVTGNGLQADVVLESQGDLIRVKFENRRADGMA